MTAQWYSSGYSPSPPRDHPAESFWTLERHGRQVACELRDHGEPAGAEVHLLRNGEFYAGRRFDTRDLAFRHADGVRVASSATASASNPHSTDYDLAADACHGGNGHSDGRGVDPRDQWDGYRIIAVKDGARVHPISRSCKK